MVYRTTSPSIQHNQDADFGRQPHRFSIRARDREKPGAETGRRKVILIYYGPAKRSGSKFTSSTSCYSRSTRLFERRNRKRTRTPQMESPAREGSQSVTNCRRSGMPPWGDFQRDRVLSTIEDQRRDKNVDAFRPGCYDRPVAKRIPVFLLVGVLVCAGWSLFWHGSHGDASRPPDPTSPQAIVQPALKASTPSQKKLDIPGGGEKVSKGLRHL